MLRNQLVRLLRRAAEQRLLALVAFVLAVAVEFWAMRVPVSGGLPDPAVAPAGHALTLVGVGGDPAILHHQGAGGIDVRFTRARLAPETAALLAQLGVALPAEEGPISWVTTAGADAVSVLDVARGGSAGDVGVLTLRLPGGPASSVAQLELDADAPLDVTVGTPLVPGAPPTRKLLRVGGREIALDGALPLRVSVPAPAALRVVLPLAPSGDAARVQLGAAAAENAGLTVRAVGVRDADDGVTWFACAAPAGRLLWRGAASLRAGRCPGAGMLQVAELRIASDRIEAVPRGSGWLWREGAAAGTTLLERVIDNPALAVLLMLVDALLAGWVLLAALSLRRVGRYRVFMSYRRDDSAGHAGRLYARLVENLGRDAVFIDVERIPPGAYFDEVIVRRIADAESVLVVIAPDWLSASDAAGRRRLEVPEDFVRREVEMALARGKRVIPVLVGGAQMPAEKALPPTLRPLARHNAVVVSHASFDRDADALADVLGESPEMSAASEPVGR